MEQELGLPKGWRKVGEGFSKVENKISHEEGQDKTNQEKIDAFLEKFAEYEKILEDYPGGLDGNLRLSENVGKRLRELERFGQLPGEEDSLVSLFSSIDAPEAKIVTHSDLDLSDEIKIIKDQIFFMKGNSYGEHSYIDSYELKKLTKEEAIEKIRNSEVYMDEIKKKIDTDIENIKKAQGLIEKLN